MGQVHFSPAGVALSRNRRPKRLILPGNGGKILFGGKLDVIWQGYEFGGEPAGKQKDN
jgi:hypothetical protein